MKKFIEQFKTIKYFTGKNGQFTTHYSLFTKNLVPQCLSASWIIRVRTALASCNVYLNERKFLSNLVPQCLRAFTLAETLIVIGIIGVVAALTLPNLNHATGDKETVTRVKKIYSSLTDAVDRAQVIYGDFDTWFNDLSSQEEKNERFAKRVTEFLKVSKDCGFGEGCWADAPLYYFADEDDGRIHFENYLETMQSVNTYMVSLADGVSLGFDCGAATDDGCFDYKIRVDVNGPNKGKNTTGVDNFDFSILVDNPDPDSLVLVKNQLCPSTCFFSPEGDLGAVYNASNYSTAWIIINDNLDYLKCWDVLNWETQTSCK